MNPNPKQNDEAKDQDMPFLQHVRALRRCLFVSTAATLIGAVACFANYEWIVALLAKPLQNIPNFEGQNEQLYVHSILEGFLTKMKLSLLSGFLITSPIHLFNALRFLFPGLRRKEKRVLILFLLASTALIACGTYLSFFKLIPYSIGFLTQKHFIPEQVGFVLGYQKSLFYVVQLLLLSLLLFQLPLLLEILLMMGILKRRSLWRSSRFVVIGIFGLSALITPPDPLSQVGFSLPLVLLFFAALLIAKLCRFGEDTT